MNPYDLKQTIELPDNQITRIAKRAERRRKIYQILTILLTVLLVCLAFYSFHAEAPVYVYLLLYLMWIIARTCLRFCGDYHDKKIVDRLKTQLDMELTGPYEYNLVHYRTLRHMKKSSKQILLLQLARQEILLGRPGQARMAFAEIALEDLPKNELQTYYFYQTAASYFLHDEKWKLQLEQCIAIPVKGSKWGEAQIRELFSGEEKKLIDALLTWGKEENKKYEKLPRAIFWLGILILVTGIFMVSELFFPDYSYAYYQRSLIFMTGIYLCWIVMSVWWLILLCKLALSMPGKERKGKALLIIELILLCICLNLTGILVWADLGDKMKERSSFSLENLLTDLMEEYGEDSGSEHSQAGADTDLTESENDTDVTENLKDADGNERDGSSGSDNAEAVDTATDPADGSGSIGSAGANAERHASEAAKGPITAEEFDSFKIPKKLSQERIFDRRDTEEHIVSGDYIGTWCDEYKQESFRLTEDGAYVYIPFLDLYGDTLCEWEIVTEDTPVGYMPTLKIYYAGRDVGPLAYYLNGYEDNYFWCTDQAEVFYRQ